ncbi:hypothetical protein Tco_0558120, partial [Tanacetum coccineum]
MTTLAEFMIIVGANNHPPMLEKSFYDLWKSQDGTTRTNNYEELLVAEKLQADCDLKAINIVFQGLPPDVYAIVNHHKVTKEIRDRVKLFMQGTKLSLQEKKCKLYDEFDKFSFVKGETLYQYYWRFAQLINNMNVINMSMRPVQVNTKFLNSLPLEWSKFVMDVKLVTVQQVQGRQGQSYAGTGYKGKGHMARQCTQPKRPRNVAWFKKRQCWLKHKNSTEDLDAYDSDCDDVSNAKAVLMANLSNYGFDIISE